MSEQRGEYGRQLVLRVGAFAGRQDAWEPRVGGEHGYLEQIRLLRSAGVDRRHPAGERDRGEARYRASPSAAGFHRSRSLIAEAQRVLGKQFQQQRSTQACRQRNARRPLAFGGKPVEKLAILAFHRRMGRGQRCLVHARLPTLFLQNGAGQGVDVAPECPLGGKLRETIKVYSWIGGDRPAEVAAGARDVVARGFQALKMNGTEELQIVDSHDKIDATIERVAMVREAVGPDIGIAVDFHGRVHRPMARMLVKELEPYRLMFIEEPVLSENREALKEIAALGSTPIALGERLYSRWDFKPVFEEAVVDIIQPDLSHAGGITECRKIAAMAEAYDVAVAPHCPLGPIALAACLQLDAVSYNCFIQEQSLGIHYNAGNDLLDYAANKDVFRYEGGYVAIPDGPGLGVEIDEDHVKERAKEAHRWRNPVWRHKDGSFAEW